MSLDTVCFIEGLDMAMLPCKYSMQYLFAFRGLNQLKKINCIQNRSSESLWVI